ncbi:hypothetical protein ACH4NF_35410 [Streptomyces sp. NPDC017248]|uniref:hypothetical protein n=1 Tax=unclassified Streptomyces TaxID=2593676 RepID=UPI0037AB5049
MRSSLRQRRHRRASQHSLVRARLWHTSAFHALARVRPASKVDLYGGVILGPPR